MQKGDVAFLNEVERAPKHIVIFGRETGDDVSTKNNLWAGST